MNEKNFTRYVSSGWSERDIVSSIDSRRLNEKYENENRVSVCDENCESKKIFFFCVLFGRRKVVNFKQQQSSSSWRTHGKCLGTWQEESRRSGEESIAGRSAISRRSSSLGKLWAIFSALLLCSAKKKQPAPDERRTKKAAKIESCRFFFPFSRSAHRALLVSVASESVWLAHIVKCTGELTVKTLIYHQSSAVREIGDDKVAVFGVMEFMLHFAYCCGGFFNDFTLFFDARVALRWMGTESSRVIKKPGFFCCIQVFFLINFFFSSLSF